MKSVRSESRTSVLLLSALTLLTIVIYWPALHGGYIFDDRFYFVENPGVHVTTHHLADWLNALLSQAGTNQFRGLSMLTFAANYYFTGLDPFWVKLTNLFVHATNGLFLFLMLRELLRWRTEMHPDGSPAVDSGCVAALVAGAWMLLPINLTDVAYVTQRMEALANLFVLVGAYGYLRARRSNFAGRGGATMMWVSLLGGLMFGFSAKESAVLLPLYTACMEFSLTGFRNRDGSLSRAATSAHLCLLALPFVAGLVWISTWIFSSVPSTREFSIGERLLTEPRVLFDYVRWTLLPHLSELSFYHDDLRASHGLLDPPTTLLAILGLIGLLGVARWQRKARPLLCLGILWFFAGHALTATVIPLELVFEHRNYFPSIGLLLASAALVALEPGFRRRAAQAVVAAGFISLFAFTTFLRAEEWSHPLRLAYSEAQKRPNSARAQYELARALILAADDTGNSTLLQQSIAILERTARLPDSGIAPLQALIFLHRQPPRQIDPAWWQAIVEKLRSHPPSQTDIDALVFLGRCQAQGVCPKQTPELTEALAAALTSSHSNVLLLSTYADLAANELGDPALAERLFREAVAAKPAAPAYRVDLVHFLIATQQYDAAEQAIAAFAPWNKLGALDALVANLEAQLRQARAGAPPEGMLNSEPSR